jgi:hypothetical protein
VLGLSEHDVFAREVETDADTSVDLHDVAEHEILTVTQVDSAPETVTHLSAREDHSSPVPSSPTMPQASEATAAKPKTSLWTIVSLFFAALAIAAYLQPQEEEAAEAAPPLQAVPETETAASAAESAASTASATETTTSAAGKTAVATASSPAAVSASAAAPVAASPASRAP